MTTAMMPETVVPGRDRGQVRPGTGLQFGSRGVHLPPLRGRGGRAPQHMRTIGGRVAFFRQTINAGIKTFSRADHVIGTRCWS